MKKIQLSLIALTLLFATACSKRSHPSKNATVIYSEEGTTKKTANVENSTTPKNIPTRKPVSPKTEKQLFPETIYVNDAAAKKSVDGRLYYDVEGHRYWKNYKDGKYYLFNKSMYKNPDFKPPSNKNGA